MACSKEQDTAESLLRLNHFFRAFIQDYATIAFPSSELLHKSKSDKLEFGTAEQKAFDTLRLALISKPVLRAPDMSKPWIIMADASKVAASAILMQREGE